MTGTKKMANRTRTEHCHSHPLPFTPQLSNGSQQKDSDESQGSKRKRQKVSPSSSESLTSKVGSVSTNAANHRKLGNANQPTTHQTGRNVTNINKQNVFHDQPSSGTSGTVTERSASQMLGNIKNVDKGYDTKLNDVASDVKVICKYPPLTTVEISAVSGDDVQTQDKLQSQEVTTVPDTQEISTQDSGRNWSSRDLFSDKEIETGTKEMKAVYEDVAKETKFENKIDMVNRVVANIETGCGEKGGEKNDKICYSDENTNSFVNKVCSEKTLVKNKTCVKSGNTSKATEVVTDNLHDSGDIESNQDIKKNKFETKNDSDCCGRRTMIVNGDQLFSTNVEQIGAELDNSDLETQAPDDIEDSDVETDHTHNATPIQRTKSLSDEYKTDVDVCITDNQENTAVAKPSEVLWLNMLRVEITPRSTNLGNAKAVNKTKNVIVADNDEKDGEPLFVATQPDTDVECVKTCIEKAARCSGSLILECSKQDEICTPKQDSRNATLELNFNLRKPSNEKKSEYRQSNRTDTAMMSPPLRTETADLTTSPILPDDKIPGETWYNVSPTATSMSSDVFLVKAKELDRRMKRRVQFQNQINEVDPVVESLHYDMQIVRERARNLANCDQNQNKIKANTSVNVVTSNGSTVQLEKGIPEQTKGVNSANQFKQGNGNKQINVTPGEEQSISKRLVQFTKAQIQPKDTISDAIDSVIRKSREHMDMDVDKAQRFTSEQIDSNPRSACTINQPPLCTVQGVASREVSVSSPSFLLKKQQHQAPTMHQSQPGQSVAQNSVGTIQPYFSSTNLPTLKELIEYGKMTPGYNVLTVFAKVTFVYRFVHFPYCN